jgi:hypothetical protein
MGQTLDDALRRNQVMRDAVSAKASGVADRAATAARFDELSFLDLFTIFEMVAREESERRSRVRNGRIVRHIRKEIRGRDQSLAERLGSIVHERDEIAHGFRVGKPLSNDLLTTRQILGAILDRIGASPIGTNEA